MEPKAFDLLDINLSKGESIDNIVNIMQAGDAVTLQPRAFYDKYLNTANPKNPKAPTAKELDEAYNHVSKIKSMYDRGLYMDTGRGDAETNARVNMLGIKPVASIRQGPIASKDNAIYESLLTRPGRLMSDKSFAYNSLDYAVEDESSETGMRFVPKESNWQFKGKMVFVPDPRTGGTTQTLLAMDHGGSSFGHEQLQTLFGMPDDFERNWFKESLKNMVSSVGRMGASTTEFIRPFIQNNTRMDIFKDANKLNRYLGYLRPELDAAQTDILDQAIKKNDPVKMLDAFNYLEQSINKSNPVKRNQLKSLRMSEDWNKRDEMFNGYLEGFKNMQNMTAENFNKGALSSFGSFMYAGSAVMSDLAIQIGLGGPLGGVSRTAALIGSSGIGTVQAVGANMQAMAEVGFDEHTRAIMAAIQSPIIGITEFGAGKLWMHKGLPKDILNKYFQQAKEVYQEAANKFGTRLTAQQAIEVAQETTKKLWNNPQFKKMLDEHYIADIVVDDLIKPMAVETVQENFEQFAYNASNYVRDKYFNPDYYGDEMNMGIDKLWGKGGIINPNEILETTLLTAFATGSVNAITNSSQGRWKEEYRKNMRNLTQRTWAAEQATQGNLDAFLKYAANDVKNDVNTFGSKGDKLNALGVDNIVLTPDQAKAFEGMNLGTPEVNDKNVPTGNVIIDNLADLNYYDFLQGTLSTKQLADENNLNGSTINSRMLNQIFDINNVMLSTRAINAAAELSQAKKDLADAQAMQADPAKSTEKTAEEWKKTIGDLEIAQKTAQDNLDAYAKPEGDSPYSKAVNDHMKDMLTTYSIAEQKVKELLGNKFSTTDDKTYDKIKEIWKDERAKNYSYDQFKDLYNALNTTRERNNKKLEKDQKLYADRTTGKMFNTDPIVNSIESMMSTVKEHLGKSNVDFMSGLKNLGIDKIVDSINNAFTSEGALPSQIQEMASKYNEMYMEVQERMGAIKQRQLGTTEMFKSAKAGKTKFEKAFAQVLSSEDYSTELKDMEGYSTWAKKAGKEKIAQMEDYYENLRTDFNNINDDDFVNQQPEEQNISDNQRMSFFNQEAVRLSKEEKKSLSEFIDEYLDFMISRYQMANDALDPKKRSEVLQGLDSDTDLINMDDAAKVEYLDKMFGKVRKLFEVAQDVTGKLHGTELFNRHSTSEEKAIVAKIVEKYSNNNIQGKLDQVKKLDEQFMRDSNAEAMTTMNGQHHSRSILINNQISAIKTIKALAFKDDKGMDILSDELMAKMDSFAVTDDNFKKKGNYSKEELQALERVEKALHEAIDTLQKHKNIIFDNEKVDANGLTNMERLFEPFSILLTNGASYTNETQIMRFNESVGFDGAYNSVFQGHMSNDVTLMHFEALSTELSELVANATSYHDARVLLIDRFQLYTTILAMIDGGVSMKQLYDVYNSSKGSKRPTYEQEMNINLSVAILTGSRISSMMEKYEDSWFKRRKAEGSKKSGFVGKSGVLNSILIPGDYGTGKTEIVLPRVLDILKKLKKLPANITVFSPYSSLSTTHEKVFDTKSNKNVTLRLTESIKNNELIAGDNLWIIDEASLLTQDDITMIDNISRKAATTTGAALKIVFLADMNQMQAENGDYFYPPIMNRTLKGVMLSEQFSSLSPILKEQGAFWRNALTIFRNVGQALTFTNLQKAYSETIDGVRYGSHYCTDTEDVFNLFKESVNTDKALLFNNDKEYKDFADKFPEIKEEKYASKVYFLDTKNNEKRIQGQRRQEVYIVSNYSKMKGTAAKILTSMYTAVGRASTYVAINVGAEQANKFNVKTAKEASNIGDTTKDNEMMQRKIKQMVDYSNIRYAVLADKPVVTSTETKIPKPVINTDKLQDFDKPGSDHRFTFTTDSGEELEVIDIVSHTIDPVTGDEYLFHNVTVNGIPLEAIEGVLNNRDNLEGEILSQWVVRNILNAFKNIEKPKPEPETDQKPKINTGKKTTAPKVEKLEPNPSPEGLTPEPKTHVPSPFDGEVPEVLPTDEQTQDKVYIYRSQAENWANDMAIYSTSFFVEVPGSMGKKMDDNDLSLMHGMHALIMYHLAENGNTQLVYKAETDAVDKDNIVRVYSDVLVVRFVPDSHTKTVLGKLAKNMRPGLIKNEVDRLVNLNNNLFMKEMEMYNDFSVMANPITNPAMSGMNSTTMSAHVSQYADLIRDGFKPIIDQYEAEGKTESVAIFRQQMEAQIAIGALREKGRQMWADAGTTNEVVMGDLQMPTFTSVSSKVLYGEELHTLDVVDLSNNEAIILNDDKNTKMDEQKGRMTINVTYDPLMENNVPIIVQMPKMNDSTVSAKMRSWAKDDRDMINSLPTSVGTKKANAKAYAFAMNMFRSTNLYQILMNNRANIIKNFETITGEEYSNYMELTENKWDVNPVGDTMAEQIASMQRMAKIVYNEHPEMFYMPIKRVKIDGKYQLAVDGSVIKTHAVRVNNPHKFYGVSEILDNKDVPTVEPEPETKKERKPKFEDSQSNIPFDQTREDINPILKRIMGASYLKQQGALTFHNELITADGILRSGYMIDGRMGIAGVNGLFKRSTAYHESFHIVWNYMLDPVAREKYEKLASDRAYMTTGKRLSGIALEEWIANSFASKAMEKEKQSPWVRFKNWLKSLVDYVHGSRDELAGLYNDVYNGKFANKSFVPTSMDKPLFEDADEVLGDQIDMTSDEVESDIRQKDRTARYNALTAMFPTDVQMIDKARTGIRYSIAQNSPLGNNPDTSAVESGIIASIHEARKQAREDEEYFATEQVTVLRNGVLSVVSVSDLVPADYERIYTGERPTQSSKAEAKMLFRNWFLNQQENMDIILESVLPTFDAFNNTFDRGDLVDGGFTWKNLDPNKDGITAEMRLMLETIPHVRVVNKGKKTMHYTVDPYNGKFVDFKTINDLIRRVGVDAKSVYELNKHKPGYSKLDAFIDSLDEHIRMNGDETDRNGEYKSGYTAALVAFRQRFFYQGEQDINIGRDIALKSIYAISSGILTKRGEFDESNPITDAEIKRAASINEFLAAMTNHTMSYELNNFGKVTVSGSERSGFEYHFTEYGNDFYSTKKNHIKDQFDLKLNEGLFNKPSLVKKFNNFITVDDNAGTITYGKKNANKVRPRTFVTFTQDGKFTFSSTTTDDILRDIASMDPHLGLGIGRNIIPAYVLRRFLERTTMKSWDDMPAVKKASKEDIIGKGLTSAFTPRDFIANLVGNILMAHQAQMNIIKFSVRYMMDNKEVSYNHSLPISEHALKLQAFLNEHERNLQGKKNPGKLIVNGVAMPARDVMKLLGNHSDNKAKGIVDKFVTAIGAENVHRNAEGNETLSLLGMDIAIPSQFYPAIQALAADAAASMGQPAGATVYRADGKRVHMLQMENKINSIMTNLRNNRSQLADPTIHPYASVGDEVPRMSLNAITTSIGINRDYYGAFTKGTEKYTTLDNISMGVSTFISQALKTKGMNPSIVTPMMPITDSGDIYFMHHTFDKPLIWVDHGTIQLVDKTAYEMVRMQALKYQKSIDAARMRYNNLILEVNEMMKAEGVKILLPSEKVDGKKVYSETEFISTNGAVAEQAMRRLTPETYAKVINHIKSSPTNKVTDVTIVHDDDGFEWFKLGNMASGNIPNVTDGIYNAKNRKMLIDNVMENVGIDAGKKRTNPVIIDGEVEATNNNYRNMLRNLFAADFQEAMKYMDSHGFNDSNKMLNGVQRAVPASNFNGVVGTSKMQINPVLWAYYMAHHITNNAIDDVIGGTMDYKDIYDKVKRSGTLNTPKMSMTTDMQINGHYVGSPARHVQSVTMEDLPYKVTLFNKEELLPKATDGEVPMSAFFRKQYAVATGGKSFSVTGDGSMVKLLATYNNMATNTPYILKFAGKFITESDFENHTAYRNMQRFMFEMQDKYLNQDPEWVELTKGTAFENFSWLNEFDDFTSRRTFNEAIDELFDMFVNSQYAEREEGNEFSVKGRAIYNKLANSVMFGLPTKNTRKTGLTSYHSLDFRPESYSVPEEINFESIDMDEMGAILNAEQPVDDSKKQSRAAQQEAFIGNTSFQLVGELANKYSSNPGIAVSMIQAELYDKAKVELFDAIGKIKPPTDATGPAFNTIDWMSASVKQRDDLDYAIAQYEWYVRDNARKGLERSSVPGNFIEMLNSKDVTSQVPQMRIKMVQFIIEDMNRKLVKPGMNGMRTVQATGIWHELYDLRETDDYLPYTRQDAIRHIYGDKVVNPYAPEVEKSINALFSRRTMKDMRVDDGQTKHGEVIMPYIYAKTFGLRKRGENGSNRNESLRDLLSVGPAMMHQYESASDFKKALNDYYPNRFSYDSRFFDSILVRKALANLKKNKSEDNQFKNVAPDALQAFAKYSEDNMNVLLNNVWELYQGFMDTAVVYANRVPANRLGSGAFLDLTAIHHDGNEAYIPLGMPLLNDSDFDIDQLAMYINKLKRDGTISDELYATYNRMIMNIFEQVYMAKENQENIFVNTNTKNIDDIAKKSLDNNEVPLNANTLYSNYKLYNDNKVGANGIGIIANTLSASSILLTVADHIDAKKCSPMIRKILANSKVTGRESLIMRVGDWLQVALDNNKNNTIGRYGITEEAIPMVAAWVAVGSSMGQTEDEFYEEIKDFFSDQGVLKVLNHVAIGSSIHFKSKEHQLYNTIMDSIQKIKTTRYAAADKKIEEIFAEHQAFGSEFIPYVNAQIDAVGDKAIKHVSMTVNSEKKYVYIKDFNFVTSTLQADDAMLAKWKEYQAFSGSYNRQQRDMDTQARLEFMAELNITSETIRGVSNILTLRNGIPAVDWNFVSKVNIIEKSLGKSLDDYVQQGVSYETNSNRNDYLRYYAQHDNDFAKAKEGERLRIIDKANAIYDALPLGQVITAFPMMKKYIEHMSMMKNIHSEMFAINNDHMNNLFAELHKRVGLNTWEFSNQMQMAHNALNELVLDEYFRTKYAGKVINIGLPLEGSNGYTQDSKSIFNGLRMDNVLHRQIFSLQMPNFIDAFTNNFETPQQMEDYFAAFSNNNENPFAGISSVLFDEEGNRVRNVFIDNLKPIGTGERQYMGIYMPNGTIMEEERKQYTNDFNRLPEGVREIFILNELINNKLKYRQGSIGDIIGLKPYKEGISRTYELMNKSIKSGNASFLDPQHPDYERFMDYIAYTSGMTPYVKAENMRDISNPMYINSSVDVGKKYSLNFTYKRGVDGLYSIISVIPSRAGFSSESNVISSVGTINLSADQHEELHKDGKTSKVFLKGHNYRNNDYYHTDSGEFVRVLTHEGSNSITLESLMESANAEQVALQIQRAKDSANNVINISRAGGEGGKMIAIDGQENLHNSLSVFGERSLTIPGGIIDGIPKPITFSTLKNAVNYVRSVVFKQLVSDKASALKSIEPNFKKADETYRMNSINYELEKLLNGKRKGVGQMIAVNMDHIIPYLVKLSFTGNGKAFDLMKKEIIVRGNRTNEEKVFDHYMSNGGKQDYSTMLRNMDKQFVDRDGKIKVVRTVEKLVRPAETTGVNARTALNELVHNESLYDILFETPPVVATFDTESLNTTNQLNGEKNLKNCNN